MKLDVFVLPMVMILLLIFIPVVIGVTKKRFLVPAEMWYVQRCARNVDIMALVYQYLQIDISGVIFWYVVFHNWGF